MEMEQRLKQLEQENQRLKRALEELSVLNEIATAISSTQSLDRILDLVVQKSLKNMMAQQGAVLLLDEKIEEKPFQTMIRGWDTTSENLPFRLDTQLTGWMLKNRQPLLINDLAKDKRFHLADSEDIPIRSLLCTPLLLKGRMIGLVILFNKKSDEGFNIEDQRLLSIIAAQSAQIIENARLLREEQELIKMQEELRLAFDIQTNLLPEKPPSIEGYDIFARSIPAKEVGGDYFDFIPVGDNQLNFCLGDVSGKGMGAALLMANLQATIQGQSQLDLSIPKCLENANRLLFRNTSPEKFATLFYGWLDFQNHEIRYCNAGHNLPYLFSDNRKPRPLSEGGIILGCLENVNFEEQKVSIQKGDTLLVFSDGISEAMDPDFQEFGETRLVGLLENNREKSAREIIDIIIDGVTGFSGEAPQTDDMTLMVLKRLG
jgi:sigma-B regulation protein RsbU (phosphoserine phosphatase)